MWAQGNAPSRARGRGGTEPHSVKRALLAGSPWNWSGKVPKTELPGAEGPTRSASWRAWGTQGPASSQAAETSPLGRGRAGPVGEGSRGPGLQSRGEHTSSHLDQVKPVALDRKPQTLGMKSRRKEPRDKAG